MVSQEIVIDEAVAANDDKEMAEPEAIYQEEIKAEAPVDPFALSSPLMSSTISIDAKSPKEIYFEAVENVQDDNMKLALKSLYDFGFTNFNVNNMLMLKHGDVNVVAN